MHGIARRHYHQRRKEQHRGKDIEEDVLDHFSGTEGRRDEERKPSLRGGAGRADDPPAPRLRRASVPLSAVALAKAEAIQKLLYAGKNHIPHKRIHWIASSPFQGSSQ